MERFYTSYEHVHISPVRLNSHFHREHVLSHILCVTFTSIESTELATSTESTRPSVGRWTLAHPFDGVGVTGVLDEWPAGRAWPMAMCCNLP